MPADYLKGIRTNHSGSLSGIGMIVTDIYWSRAAQRNHRNEGRRQTSPALYAAHQSPNLARRHPLLTGSQRPPHKDAGQFDV